MSDVDPHQPYQGPSRRNVFRGAALTSGTVLFGGAFTIGTATTAAAAPEPQLHTRADWGARPPSSPVQVLDTPPDTIIVHHTAGGNSDDTSVEHAYKISRDIQNLHMDSNGWIDAGQQLTISRGGHVVEGRDKALTAIRDGKHCYGTHVADHNGHCIGIENEGIYVTDTPPKALVDSLVATLAWLCTAYSLDPQAAILGHRDFNATQCPGDVLYGMLPDIRNAVADSLAASGVRTTPGARRGLPADHRPGYPAVPKQEPKRELYHGPARGPDDISR
ncbi:N-acetylmuramoyl-L-alanine amidase [Murinocardiopsis flavida]|uniref:N-acetylmuramoyl-L-alanine amidase n=1 Tax=Murinocardiopsis flavida TaxID=645275 RepID=A0A2P8DE37_9ACTN|nr:peptidoglycan recognition family protein [Murinocardiopsis flavida]PSK95493.1 N-acetylmuramoyl-L-alanine amidase [Murinocardiopsis flavida]